VARCAVPAPLRRQWNEAITQQLQTRLAALQGMVVGGYWPFRGEFDPRFVLRHLRRGDARTALPVVLARNAPLQFRAWWPGAPMRKAALGLPVPEGTEVLAPQALLIPPLGFDARGYRLGYGGGYFDRTLAALPDQPLKIGVAFELSRMATIRPQWHDIAMDFIVSELGLYRVTPHGLARVDDAWRLASA
jgi:5,10-methenyltetrahydrofolate synthetase